MTGVLWCREEEAKWEFFAQRITVATSPRSAARGMIWRTNPRQRGAPMHVVLVQHVLKKQGPEAVAPVRVQRPFVGRVTGLSGCELQPINGPDHQFCTSTCERCIKLSVSKNTKSLQMMHSIIFTRARRDCDQCRADHWERTTSKAAVEGRAHGETGTRGGCTSRNMATIEAYFWIFPSCDCLNTLEKVKSRAFPSKSMYDIRYE
jgi:hypothetical protein